jgi:RNA polymerase sigma-70 factor (ECF subfamily)
MNDPQNHDEPVLDFESVSMLIPKSIEGDQAARNQLLDQVRSYLDLMAARHLDKSLQQKVGPSDVVQQTLTQVIENFDQFQGETAAEFHGWLKAIVVNEIRKMRRTYRAAKRDIGRERQLDSPSESVRGPAPPADLNMTPSSEAIAAEQLGKFHEILAKLPEDYATVIRLRSIEQLPFKQIADQMDRSHDSVTKLWYRAVVQFEELLRESGNFNSGI